MPVGKAFVLLLLAVCAGCTTAAPAGNASSAGPCQATPAETEGPYFKAGSPERASLVEPGMAGTRLTITGRVLTVDCRPVTGAVLDFWQADTAGTYDNTGYRLRGHQATDSSGAYALQTVVPGEYPGRTQHIHVKVGAPGPATLTTQLYFPGGTRNQSDLQFNQALLLHSSDAANGKAATFDFVLNFR